MLKRLRTAHPILYCILSEVLFLGSMVVFSLLATIGLATLYRKIEEYGIR